MARFNDDHLRPWLRTVKLHPIQINLLIDLLTESNSNILAIEDDAVRDSLYDTSAVMLAAINRLEEAL
jgi:hypothetical protein